MAQVYQLLGAGGRTMVPIQTSGLKLGQVVSYGDMANPRSQAVVVETEGGTYGQRCIFVASLQPTEVSATIIEGCGGWQMEEEVWTADEVRALESRAAGMARERRRQQEQAEENARQVEAEGEAVYDKIKPAWAVAAIVAEFQIDDSDSQSDHFATRKGRQIFLAWSKHERNMFPELRKAAALHPETAHLGPGKGVYVPTVVCSSDIRSNDSGYWKGSVSNWHSELHGNRWDRKTFQTRTEAVAYTTEKGAPEPILFDGVLATFEWEILERKIEHRDTYSMGRGMVLGADDYTTGWTVRKQRLPIAYSIFANHITQ